MTEQTTHETTTRSWDTGGTSNRNTSGGRTRRHHCSTCSCGWEGTTRGSRTEADQDGRRHEEGTR